MPAISSATTVGATIHAQMTAQKKATGENRTGFIRETSFTHGVKDHALN